MGLETQRETERTKRGPRGLRYGSVLSDGVSQVSCGRTKRVGAALRGIEDAPSANLSSSLDRMHAYGKEGLGKSSEMEPEERRGNLLSLLIGFRP